MSKLYWGGVFFSCLMMCNVLNAAPAAFEKNEGQIMTTEQEPATDVLFRAKIDNFEVYFFEDKVSYVARRHAEISPPENADFTYKHFTAYEKQEEVYRYDLTFANASSEVELVAENHEANNKLRYYRGDNAYTPKLYERVVYQNLYEGIDLVFYVTEQGFKYDFEVAPGADPAQIELIFDGGADFEVSKQADESLLLSHALGEVKEARPVSYAGGAEVESFFKRTDKGWGFELSDYDESQKLVIDPFIYYSSYIGGTEGERVGHAYMKGNGENIMVGWSTSTNYPVTTGLQSFTANTDVVLTSFDHEGQVNWSTYYGGSQKDYGHDVTVDGSGNIYIVGATESPNLPNPNNAYSGTGWPDAFAARFDQNGVNIWSEYIGGEAADRAYGVATDGSELYVVGTTVSNGFPLLNPIAGQTTITPGWFSGFISVLNVSGGLLRSTYYGTDFAEDFISDVEVADAPGHTLLIYGTTGLGSPTTVLPSSINSLTGIQDLFAARIESDFTAVHWSLYVGGGDIEDSRLSHMEKDGSGAMHIVGSSNSTNAPVIGGNANTGSGFGGYYARIDHTMGGASVGYSSYFAGNGDDVLYAVGTSGSEVYLVGQTESSNLSLPSGVQPIQDELEGSKSGMFYVLGSGGSINYGTYYGEESSIYSVNSYSGKLYFHGDTEGDVPISSGAAQPSKASGSSQDAFISILELEICGSISFDQVYENDFNGGGLPVSLIDGAGTAVYQVKGTVSLTNDIEIKNATFYMDECSRIVSNGHKLTLDNVEFRGCGLWRGIRIEDGAIEMNETSIRHAEVGLYAKESSVELVHNNTFIDNYHHVALIACDDFLIQSTGFESLSKVRTTCSPIGVEQFYEDFDSAHLGKQIYVENSSVGLINGLVMYNETDAPGTNAIHIVSSNNIIIETIDVKFEYQHAIYVYESSGVSFNQLMYAHKSNFAGFSSFDSEGITVNNATFNQYLDKDYVGFYIKNTNNFLLQSSVITGQKYGLVYLNDLEDQAMGAARENVFEDNEIGIVIAPTVNPLENDDPLNQNNSNGPIIFEWTCNEIYNNDAGVIGSGNIINQASSSVGTGNDYRSNTADENLNVDILWSQDFDFDYFYDQRFSGNPPSSNATGTNGGYLIDGMLVPSNPPNGVGIWAAAADNVCSSLLLQPLSVEESEEVEVSVYPNPFQAFITLETSAEDRVLLQVFDLQGRNLHTETFTGRLQLNTTSWHGGVYILQLSSNDGQIVREKVIKY